MNYGEVDFTDDEMVEAYMQFLIEEGGLVWTGMSDTDEPVYNIVPEILERIAPEYLAAHYLSIETALLELYDQGLVEIEITDEGEVLYSAKKEALD